MKFIEEIKSTIGEETYLNLNKIANGLFSEKKYFGLKTPLGQTSYIDELLPNLLTECEQFEKLNLKISPIDIVNILYKCKLVKASKTIEEYREKTFFCDYVSEFDFYIPWEKRKETENTLVEDYFERLKSSIKENTLVVEISSFKGNSYEIQCFFDSLFKKLSYPFKAFIDTDTILEEYKNLELRNEYTIDIAKDFFSSPSIGFTVYGSLFYCRWFSNTWLKVFISLLKIGGYIYPGQIEFGNNTTSIQAPSFPVFLGTFSKGCFIWDEDKKLPLVKIPDGCLSRSFGNRSITNILLDNRTFLQIKNFIFDNKLIFDLLRNPWNRYAQKDILPTLDILSSVVHSTEIGAKILLIYCCLEHIFVPPNIKINNRNYIIGGIYSLDLDLIKWFNELYEYRCDYSHKGYIRANNKILSFIGLSIANTLRLLRLKLHTSNN